MKTLIKDKPIDNVCLRDLGSGDCFHLPDGTAVYMTGKFIKGKHGGHIETTCLLDGKSYSFHATQPVTLVQPVGGTMVFERV